MKNVPADAEAGKEDGLRTVPRGAAGIVDARPADTTEACRPSDEKEGRHLRSDRIAEIRHLEAIQRGEKGGVGILVGRRTARNSRKSIGSLPVAGKVSTVKSTGSKRQDRQNPGSETGEGGSLLKGNIVTL